MNGGKKQAPKKHHIGEAGFLKKQHKTGKTEGERGVF